MTVTTKKKRGRKLKPHVAADGTTINGLARRPSDGRWRIIATGYTFTEPEEEKAIDRFRELTGGMTDRMRERMESNDQITYAHMDRLWEFAGRMIRSKPKWFAKKTGVEWLAYGKELKPPMRLPTFANLEKLWTDHFDGGIEQKRKVLQAWREFKERGGVSGPHPSFFVVAIRQCRMFGNASRLHPSVSLRYGCRTVPSY